MWRGFALVTAHQYSCRTSSSTIATSSARNDAASGLSAVSESVFDPTPPPSPTIEARRVLPPPSPAARQLLPSGAAERHGGDFGADAAEGSSYHPLGLLHSTRASSQGSNQSPPPPRCG